MRVHESSCPNNGYLSSMKRSIELFDLGLRPYREVWDIQKRIQAELIDQKRRRRDDLPVENPMTDQFLFTEHPHVYTLGKSGESTHLLKTIEELSTIDAEYIEIDRGGDITYHGPGQIVGYPILDLDFHFTDIHKYLRYLEEVIIRTCDDFGIKAGRKEGLTGVWVEDEKICAMGIRCSRWVTMHGFALNVQTDLSYFDHIVPCGIKNKSVTSISMLLNGPVELSDVKKSITTHFENVFDIKMNVMPQKPEHDKQFSYL